MEKTRAQPASLAPLGIAAILVVVGWVFCGTAIYAVALGRWTEATVAFILVVVVWVFAAKWLVFASEAGPASLAQLVAQRDDALRRVGELRRYANFCELEAECWPEDSFDRAELVAYAKVAGLQADETLHKWREIEREIRAERFEQITANTRN
jgi:hypothetical protein